VLDFVEIDHFESSWTICGQHVTGCKMWVSKVVLCAILCVCVVCCSLVLLRRKPFHFFFIQRDLVSQYRIEIKILKGMDAGAEHTEQQQQHQHYHGTTPPISTNFPSPEELFRNEELTQYLRERDDVYESRSGHEKRMGIIRKVSEMLQRWAQELLVSRGCSEEVASNGGGIQVRLFGSTRLGVNAPDADIDCLCISPRGITREDFFNSFGIQLERRMDVEGVYPVPEAFTPVLKFTMDDQPVDMIFVEMHSCPIPDTFNILDIKNISGMEEQDIRSLNGARVAECIFASVPNLPNFGVALRTIKHWARQRGIYSNILGFLSGCSCAIMVAFVCQRFPNACSATIVENFFLLFSHWMWSPGMPVLLGEIETREAPQSVEDFLTAASKENKYIRVWNPKLNPTDAHQLMPIITPAYPAMNAAYNVGAPQFRRIQVGSFVMCF
jgi:poly(A) polymerase